MTVPRDPGAAPVTVIAMAVVGPTAAGKSAIALGLARRHRDIELVSVDSMQVYRGMDIGTAKPTPADRAEVAHHLIDLVDPDDDYTVSRFQDDMSVALEAIAARGHRAVLVGGTGLYLRAAIDRLEIPGRFPEIRADLDRDDDAALHGRLEAMDPLAASRMEPTNRRRVLRALEVTIGSGRPFSSYGPGMGEYPPLEFPLVGLRRPRDEIDARIEARYADQLGAGFVAEVAGLRSRPGGISPTAGQALGYRELLDHLDGKVSLPDAIDRAIARTRRFARRQERWFRRDPRVVWRDAGPNGVVGIDDLLRD